MPPLAMGLIGSAGGLLGGLFGGNKLSSQQKALLNQLTTQMRLNQDTQNQLVFGQGGLNSEIAGLADPNFNPAVQLWQQYLQQGSPYLNQIQRATAENVASNYNNATGQANEAIRRGGYGGAPSGLQAGVAGNMQSDEAKTLSDQWLKNLLNNEQMKFSAANAYQGAQSNQVSARLAETNIFNPAQYAGPATGIANNPGQPNPVGRAIGGAISGFANNYNPSPGGGSTTTSTADSSPIQVPSYVSGIPSFYNGTSAPNIPMPPSTYNPSSMPMGWGG